MSMCTSLITSLLLLLAHCRTYFWWNSAKPLQHFVSNHPCASVQYMQRDVPSNMRGIKAVFLPFPRYPDNLQTLQQCLLANSATQRSDHFFWSSTSTYIIHSFQPLHNDVLVKMLSALLLKLPALFLYTIRVLGEQLAYASQGFLSHRHLNLFPYIPSACQEEEQKKDTGSRALKVLVNLPHFHPYHSRLVLAPEKLCG